MIVLLSADFFPKLIFSKFSARNTIKVSNSLDPDQDRHFVGPDLGPNCLKRKHVRKSRFTAPLTRRCKTKFPTVYPTIYLP